MHPTQSQLEEFREMLPRCFGSADLEFSQHPFEIQEAQLLLKFAFEIGLSFDDYNKEISTYLGGKKSSQAHIKEQLENACSLETYFSS